MDEGLRGSFYPDARETKFPNGPDDCGRRTLASQLFKALNPSFQEGLDAGGKKRKRCHEDGIAVDPSPISPLLWTTYFGESKYVYTSELFSPFRCFGSVTQNTFWSA